MTDLTADYWNTRYNSNDIGWDLGEIAPPLKDYFDQLTNKDLKILIPGGGNSYEAEYLHTKGFKNVFVVDWSSTVLSNIKKRVPSFPSEHLIQMNFFDLKMTFDLLVEQTFFCAIHPSLRFDYAEKAFELLQNNGKIVGLLFDAPLNTDKPPFGGHKSEYITNFKSHFNIAVMDNAYNSHQSRDGKELFIILKKKVATE